ncbi:MAG: cytochrome c3 family protein [Bdellovibrionota bacterium]
MKQIFPKWSNFIVPAIVVLKGAGLVGITLFVWYYFSPQYTEVGYQPKQPIEYSHKLHAGDLGIDCRYCHSSVESTPFAGIPSTQVCMNCHNMIGKDNPKLAPLRESWETGKPIEWIRVHDLPDYAYFNHSVHVHAGVGCKSCHGDVSRMEKVTRKEPLSMGWCLDCHRNPAPHLRPQSQVTNMNWKPSEEDLRRAQSLVSSGQVRPSLQCSACHR